MTSENKSWIRSAAGFIIAVVLLLLFVVIAHEVIGENEYRFDHSVDTWMDGISNPTRTKLMETITFFGSFNFLLPAYLAVGAWLYYENARSASLYFIIMGAVGAVVLFGAKYLFHRSRPDIALVHPEPGFSFPSGHTTSSVIFFGWLACLLIKRFSIRGTGKIVVILLTVMVCGAIGFSRVYLEVHYATDILAGYCLGTLYFLMSFLYGWRFLQNVFNIGS